MNMEIFLNIAKRKQRRRKEISQERNGMKSVEEKETNQPAPK